MNEMTPAYKAALIEYLYMLADDELLLGHRASEWTGIGPILEADIALSSIAQDEMGHAIFSELPRGDWGFTIVRHYLHDVAEQVRWQALAASSYAPLAQVARKLLVEEKYHLVHSQTWVRKLGNATEESHRRMQAALDRAFPYALGLFEPTELEAVRVSEGIAPAEADLQQQWLNEVVPFLQQAGLHVPAEETAEGWRPTVEPVYGGRQGTHTEYMEQLLDAMQFVYRLEPGAKW